MPENNPTSTKSLLELQDLHVSFQVSSRGLSRSKRIHAVNGVSFSMTPGESVGIVGESGCGKSTIARTILGLTDIDKGEVRFGGISSKTRNINQIRKHVQLVFQDPYSSLNPRLKLWVQVSEPALGFGMTRSRKQRRDLVAEKFQLTGLPESFMDRFPHQLSGGQRQRVAIARALAINPQVLIADEPTSSLDVNAQEEICNLLNSLRSQMKLSLLIISHDLSIISRLTDRTLVMYLGKIVEQGPSDNVLKNCQHPYTKALLDAVPKIEKENDKPRTILSPNTPSPINLPSGCAFHTRCPAAFERCLKKCPQLQVISEGHQVACFLHQ